MGLQFGGFQSTMAGLSSSVSQRWQKLWQEIAVYIMQDREIERMNAGTRVWV